MDQIQVSYGGVASPPHGGYGGNANTPFVLGTGEFIVDAATSGAARVVFLTNTGRVVSLGNGGTPNFWAGPCSNGLMYMLVEIQGYIDSWPSVQNLIFVWTLVSSGNVM